MEMCCGFSDRGSTSCTLVLLFAMASTARSQRGVGKKGAAMTQMTSGSSASIWQTDAVIPVDRWLCWVNYRGILFNSRQASM